MQALAVKGNGIYLDGTFGRGGHSLEILRRLGTGGQLLAVDRDPDAVEAGYALAEHDPRFSIVHAASSQLRELATARGWGGGVAGVLFDLGVSSPQLDSAARGFSFILDGPLDMRMNPTCGPTAADWLNNAKEPEIASVLRDYGEERFAQRIARAVCQARRVEPITTTARLTSLVEKTIPTREFGKHPATRTFQALRIQINSELAELKASLAGACRLLAAGGRLVVISFHSLEHRIVKRYFRAESRGEWLPSGVPVRDAELRRRLRQIGPVVRPSLEETARNPRSRSAVLRVAERLR